MAVFNKRNYGTRRHSAVRNGLFAISTVVAGLASSRLARADITNGFSGFAAPNINTTASTTGIGYSSTGSSFETTNGNNGEAVSGFSTSVQNITSFDATFTYTATGSADGGAFIIQNIGTSALGGGGGSGGYQGIGSASAALELEFYGASDVGFSSGGANPTNYASTQNASENSGDPIQVTVEYFNNTVTANFVDLTTGAAGARIFANQNIPAAVGGNTALLGFSAATGGLASTQTISNFTFVSGQSVTGSRIYNPIAVTGYTQQGIISVALGQSAVTATMDAGTAKTGDTWYEKGWCTYNTSTGLPTSGSTFTSQADSSHIFQMANYSSNDVVLLNSTNSGVFNFGTPKAYSALSFLTASGNGPSSFKVTITYSDGAPASTGLSVISPDWFNGSPSAWASNGRDTLTSSASAQPDNYANAGGNPNLYEEDLILPDSSDPIASVSMTYAAGGNIMVFALSGVVSNNSVNLVYDGAAATAGKFDNSSLTFGLNTASGTPTAFSNGATVTFDDTAADTLHNITVAAVTNGIKPAALVFNNSTGTAPYTFTGAGIAGPGGITMNGNGTVVLKNPNTFTGDTNIYAGTLVIGTGGTLASNNITLSTGTFLNVSGGTLTGTTLTLNDAGTVNYAPSTLSLIGLNGSGVFNSTNATGTSLTLTGSGTFSGSMSLGTGTVTVNANGSNGSTAVLSGSNSYTGGTFIKSGALEVGNGSLGTGTVTLQGGSLGAATATANVGNFITGGALILPSGSNLLELSGSTNSFTGPVVIQSSATLQLDYPGSIGGLNAANSATGTVIVASGGSLLVKDVNQTNAIGLTGGTGAPITAVISGSGVGGNGGLRGPDGGSATWAGNVNASGPATISAGNAGNFTLTGSITGSGPVLYASNSNDSGFSTITLSPPTSSSNTYTGESQVTGDYGAFGALTVALGNNNGFSTASGLDFVTGTNGQVTVDLAGYNQSVQYLTTTGAGSTNYTLTSSSGLSTLTISNGSNGTVGQNISTQITQNIAIVKTGAGTQTFSGANSYTGPTTITRGTLSAGSPMAFGSSTVVLNGGTLGLSAIASSGTPIVTSSNFSNFTLNQGTTAGGATLASVNGNTLTLSSATDGNGNNQYGIANSAFYPVKVPVSDSLGFTAKFTYDVPSGYSDGITFVLQNDPRGASAVSSSAGYELGYGGTNSIVNSAGIAFETYPFNSYNNAGFGTAFVAGGTTPGEAGSPSKAYTSTAPVTIAVTPQDTLFNQPVDVTLVYNGVAQTLTETLYGETQGTTFSIIYTGVDYSALVGGAAGGSTTAYLGFTAGVGGVASTQNISNLSYATNLSSPESIGNTIVAAAGTTSAIQLGVSAVSSNTGATVGQINISTGAVVAVTIPVAGVNRGVLFTPMVSIATSTGGSYAGKLDLVSNDLVVTGSSLAQITALVASGYNNGKWNGNGIASSAAAANTSHLTALGVIVNDNGSGTPLYGNGGTLSATFDGSTPADGNILVKYTYYGDANLDGAVDGSDYSLIDNAYITDKTAPGTLTGWYNGDFNYDGVINGSDYTLIDNTFNQQGGSLGSNPLAQISAQVGSSAVPEPATLSLLAIGAAGLLGRRKRRI